MGPVGKNTSSVPSAADDRPAAPASESPVDFLSRPASQPKASGTGKMMGQFRKLTHRRSTGH